MKFRLHIPFLVSAVLAAAAIAAACGGDDDDHGDAMGGMMRPTQPEGSIEVVLSNWEVEPAQTSAKAGKVTFWAVHDMGHMHGSAEGGATHDLQVMKRSADGTFKLVGQVQGLKMGEAKALTLDLEPGDYELACNVVEQIGETVIPHYTKGMRTNFTVTA